VTGLRRGLPLLAALLLSATDLMAQIDASRNAVSRKFSLEID
jgi:hypothetical protein